MNEKRASKKPKPTRSETLGLRLDPRMKFGLELLSREQRRSISGTVEWCAERALRSEYTDAIEGLTFDDLTHRIWDIDPLRQLVNLCWLVPRLATFEELQIYRVLSLTPDLWQGNRAPSGADSLSPFIVDSGLVLRLAKDIVDTGSIRGFREKEIDSFSIPF